LSCGIPAVSKTALLLGSLRRVSRIIVSTLSMYLLTHVVAFALLPVGIALSYRDPNKLPRLKARFGDMLFQVIGKKPVVTGIEHVANDKGYVIVSNYPSFYVLFALMALFPDARFVAHRVLSLVPLVGWMLARSRTIFVDPKRPMATRRAMDRALLSPRTPSVIIMPESRRTKDGTVRSFHRGFAYLLRHSNLNLLPVTANGFYALKPANRLYLDPDAQPTLVIHRPIPNAQARSLSDAEMVEQTERTVRGDYCP